MNEALKRGQEVLLRNQHHPDSADAERNLTNIMKTVEAVNNYNSNIVSWQRGWGRLPQRLSLLTRGCSFLSKPRPTPPGAYWIASCPVHSLPTRPALPQGQQRCPPAPSGRCQACALTPSFGSQARGWDSKSSASNTLQGRWHREWRYPPRLLIGPHISRYPNSRRF